MKHAMTDHQLRQAINDTANAIRPPIMGAKLPDEVVTKLQSHLAALLEIERVRATVIIDSPTANGAGGLS